jgi:mannose/fructose/N-acetylgalactosamine-specific phosphotransferase system component IIC
MPEDADATLMSVVNTLGVAIFGLIIAYHYLTASPKDAE